MKICMVLSEKLPVPPVRGGAIQTYVSALAPRLAKRHELTILGITDPSLPERETVQGVHYVRVPGGAFELYASGVEAFLKGSQRFDLIHIFNRPRLVLPIHEAAPHSRLVLSLHNEMFHPDKIVPAEALLVIRQVECLVTVSDYIGKTVGDLFPEARRLLKTIYSGVDLDQFVPSWSGEARSARVAMRQQHNLAGKQVILFVGRLSPKKGADVLVRAMPDLASRNPDAALVLVGSKWYGEDRVSDYVAYVRALAARSPLPVISTGFVAPEQVPAWFGVGDVFICPSLWEEPLARVHYEAMAAGLPIVTSARGGNPEVVQRGVNGVVVDHPEDPKALAAALRPLLADPGLRERMGRAGRTMAEERFGWTRVARELLDVWDRSR